MHNLQPFEEISPLFAALGDATRLRLVHKLGEDSPQSIAQLADGLGLTHQGVTKHLRVLEGAGLVSGRKVGRERQTTGKSLRPVVGYASQYA